MTVSEWKITQARSKSQRTAWAAFEELPPAEGGSGFRHNGKNKRAPGKVGFLVLMGLVCQGQITVRKVVGAWDLGWAYMNKCNWEPWPLRFFWAHRTCRSDLLLFFPPLGPQGSPWEFIFKDFFLFWCGPFLKSLLNLLQYCFCCLCSSFLAIRHVGSLLHNKG